MTLPSPTPLDAWNDAPPGSVLAVCESYEQLLQSLIARRESSGISFVELDDLTGLPDGYTSKVLGPARSKGLGQISLTTLLGALRMKLVVIADGTPRSAHSRNTRQSRHVWAPDGALKLATGEL
jgi:hypothetical protein